eukprot:jgi/Chlat1/2033/Chrsp159S02325
MAGGASYVGVREISVVLVVLLSVASTSAADPPLTIVAHRGGLRLLPEESVTAYTVGARLGAQYLEPDVVPTKDGVLVCSHDNELSATTDVAVRPEFADLFTTKEIYNTKRSGWFVEDMNLVEVKALKLVTRELPVYTPSGQGDLGDVFSILTLSEMLALTKNLSAELDRPIGVYPETKLPGYFHSQLNISVEDLLLETLKDSGFLSYNIETSTYEAVEQYPVIFQSFEDESIHYLLDQAPTVSRTMLVPASNDTFMRPLLQPINFTASGLDYISTFATNVGVWYSEWSTSEWGGQRMVDRAKGKALSVHVYSLDADAWQYREVQCAGIAGVFSNNVQAAMIAVQQAAHFPCDSLPTRTPATEQIEQHAASTCRRYQLLSVGLSAVVLFCILLLIRRHGEDDRTLSSSARIRDTGGHFALHLPEFMTKWLGRWSPGYQEVYSSSPRQGLTRSENGTHKDEVQALHSDEDRDLTSIDPISKPTLNGRRVKANQQSDAQTLEMSSIDL